MEVIFILFTSLKAIIIEMSIKEMLVAETDANFPQNLLNA
jgi:hypothetical protein